VLESHAIEQTEERPRPDSAHSRPAAAPLSVRLVSKPADLEALAPEWRRLHGEATVASVFNDWAWLTAWWRHYGERRELRVVVALRAGAMVGVLPAYVETTLQLGLPVRVLRFIGDGGDTYPDDLGPLLARGHEAAVGGTLAAALLRLPGYDVARLADIDGCSQFPSAFAAAAQAVSLKCSRERGQHIAYVRLPKDWNAFLSSVTGHRRARIRKNRAKLERAHATRFFVWSDRERLASAVERLGELHRRRWGAASAAFASTQYREVHLATMRDALAQGRLRLYCLEIAGAMAAMLYAYRLRNRIFVVQAGFDPDYAQWRPGNVLLDRALEHAIREGNEVFDFLRGEHDYKDRLATDWRETVCVSAFRPTIGAAAFRARHVYLARTRAKVRSLTKSMPFI
jgi:CelD/BcsL family acetyltransferase involved in cellulose biosynthesis